MSPKISIRLLPSQTDGRLVELAGRGQESAFETLVHRYRRPLLRYCRRLGLSDARSEDVLQRSLTKAWLALSEGKEVRDLRPWLYRIVHNDAVNSVLRSPPEHELLTDALASSSAEHTLEGRIEAREALTQVASLPQMQRHAIVLTAIEGHSHREAARALGISDGAVRGLLHRARTTLRSAAAAFFSPVLLRWPARWAGTGSLSERSTELSFGGSAMGATGVLLKGAALTATVGLLTFGAGAVHNGDRTRRSHIHGVATGDHAASAAHAAASAPATSEIALVESNGRARGHTGGERRRARHGRRRGDGGSTAPPASSAGPSVEQPQIIQPVSGEGDNGRDGAVDGDAPLDRSGGGERTHDDREGGQGGGVDEGGEAKPRQSEDGQDSVVGSLRQAGDVAHHGSSSVQEVGLTGGGSGPDGPAPLGGSGSRGDPGGTLSGSDDTSGVKGSGDGVDHDGGQNPSSDDRGPSSDGSDER